MRSAGALQRALLASSTALLWLMGCSKALDLRAHTRAGSFQTIGERKSAIAWELAFISNFGYSPDGYKYCGYYYYDDCIFIFENTTTITHANKERRILFLGANGDVYRLATSEVELGKDALTFQKRKFRSNGWCEAGVTVQ